MKVEIVDMVTIKLISEDRVEAMIMNNWIGTFKYYGGETSSDKTENTYKFYRLKK